MNKNFVNRMLLCLVAMTMACMPEVNASCVNSGFGIGLTLGTQRNTVKFNADNLNKLVDNTRTDLIKKLNDAITSTNKKFDKQNTKDTEMVDGGEEYSVTTYEEYPASSGNIKGATADKLGDAKTIKLKTKKFNSDNPTKYRIADSNDKYDKNGMCDDANGITVKKAILVNPELETYNNYTLSVNGMSNSSALSINNFYTIIKDRINYYVTPKDGFVLDEMNKDWTDDGSTNPTHVLLDDLPKDENGNITKAFLNGILGNNITLAEYKKAFSGDELFQDPNTGKYYIDTVKHRNLGLSDAFVGGGIDKLSPNTSTSQTFKDVSKWSFDVGAIIFYQYRIYDWFIRGGLFGNFPIANKKVSIMESENKSNDDNKKKSSDNDFSLEHSFDVGAQILGGYNITQAFAIVFGLEFGYSKWKLNNLDKLSSKYSFDNSLLAQWVKSGNANALDDYNKSLKNMGLSDKEKKIGKWFWRGVIGFEYNFSNFIVGLQGFFGPDTKLMKASNNSDLGDLKVSNMGARLTLAYKF